MRILGFVCFLMGYWAFSQESPQHSVAIQTAKKDFLKAEYYLDTDDIDASQNWLNQAKRNYNTTNIDTLSYYIRSLQSELFYYNRLFQFGKAEAEKGLHIAKKLEDNLLIADAYFFLGINQIELKEYKKAEQNLLQAQKCFPKKNIKKTIRAIIRPDHIANNISLVKIKLNQLDSALYYNQKAYQYALSSKSRRGVPNCEQLFGEIHLLKKQKDSAQYFLKKSIISAQESEYFDIALVSYGLLMHTTNTKSSIDKYYQSGLELLQKETINTTFRYLFFDKALQVYKNKDQIQENYILNQIIALNKSVSQRNNFYLQNVTNDYIENEKKILSLTVQQLRKEKDIVFFQLMIALLLVVTLILILLIIRRKNRINTKLLLQKNEISKDLHDDIGSGLSSILIHSDLLQKQTASHPEVQLLSSKISKTAQEISQRMSAFVWSLNDKYNTVESFTDYFKNYAQNLIEGTHFILKWDIDLPTQINTTMDGKMRKNLFLSLKEILNNALKHSKGNAIAIHFSSKKGKLVITIKDNGSGFLKPNSFGNGLKNITNRIKEIKGTIQFLSDKGLLVVIEIPLN